MNPNSPLRRTMDKEEFSALYDRCSPMAYGLAMKILKNETEAQDVVQAAFVSLWRNAGDFDPAKGQITTWLYTFVRNRCIDVLRSKRRQRHVSLDNDGVDGIETFLADGAAPLDAGLEEHELKARVAAALRTLPEAQRTTIEAAYFEGLTQQEIADRSGEPLGTVKTRLRLGLMKLVQLFKGEEPASI